MFTEHELQAWRRKLTLLRQRLDGEVDGLRAEITRSVTDDLGSVEAHQSLHRDDVSQEKSNEEVLVGMVENESFLRQEVKDALDRIDGGSFGVCESCSKPIPKSRLNFIPYARRCIPCAEA